MPKPVKYTEAEMPPPGSVFLGRLEDGRFGALLVLDRKVEGGYCMVYIEPSSWIGFQPSRPADGELRRPLMLTHHSRQNAEAGVWTATPPPDSFVPAGSITISEADRRRVGSTYSKWERCLLQILLQWRWEHDREKLLIEEAGRAELEAAERQSQAFKHAGMLKTITLASLAVRPWFADWNEDLDSPYIGPSRAVLASLIAALSESPKVTKTLARRLLKTAVLAFNQLDASTHFIETKHREDICEALELAMFAVRQPDLASEIDEWRDW